MNVMSQTKLNRVSGLSLAKGHSDGAGMSSEMVAKAAPRNNVNEAKVVNQTKLSIMSGLSLAK